jgi:hypothetical protein
MVMRGQGHRRGPVGRPEMTLGLEGKGSKRFSAQRAGGETQSAGSHAQARTQMRLAGAAFAQKDDVVMLGEIFS